MHGWLGDVRQALRQLARVPDFTAVALITLALGIGASIAIFTVINGVLLRPLPFAAAERLVTLCSIHPSVAGFCIASPPDVEDWAEQTKTLEALGLGREWSFILSGDDGAASVAGGIVTPGFFEVLSVRPALGRSIRAEDLAAGAEKVVVLSGELWQRRFGSDPAIVGQPVVLDDRSYTVVGVLPPGIDVPQLEGRDVWAPLHFPPRDEERRAWRGFLAYGRRAPGASLDQVQEELGAIAGRLAEAHPATNAGWGVEVRSLHDHVVRGVRPALLVFLAAVGLLMLIGCANVANLLLARAGGRRAEFAVRAALGASRAALVRLQLTEALLLALAGGALGLLLSGWLVNAYVALAPPGTPRLDAVALDARVALFALVAALAAGALSGLTPAWLGSRPDLVREIKAGETRTVGPRSRARGTLVTVEVAIATILLVGAGLLAQSFLALVTWEPGFERERLAGLWVLASSGKYPRGDAVAALFDRAVDELGTLPGVEAVGAASAGPVFGGVETDGITIVGRPAPAPGERPVARWYDVGPGYFAALGVPLVRGRDFTPADGRGAPPVAIVNETLARRHWPNEDPLGQRVEVHGGEVTVVGIVRDVPPLSPDEPVQAEIWWPYAQRPRWATWFVLRTGVEPHAVLAAARARLRALDPSLSVSNGATFDELVLRRAARPRFNMLLVVGFAVVALVLAAVGVYGVLSGAVTERTREIGLRVALGADTGRILRAVLGRGLAPVLPGLAIGAAGAIGLTRFLSSLLHGVAPTDPATFVTVIGVLSCVAIAACWMPARRAMKIDPIRALRTD